MKIPGLGQVTEPDEYQWRYSEPISVAILFGKQCRMVLDRYDKDTKKDDFHEAIKNFLAADQQVLKAVASHIFQYYEDCNANWETEDEEYDPQAVADEISRLKEELDNMRFVPTEEQAEDTPEEDSP